ncbi:hypothetical protein [Streptomyces cyslabdanicus]
MLKTCGSASGWRPRSISTQPLEIAHVEFGADDVPALVHRRGRYATA